MSTFKIVLASSVCCTFGLSFILTREIAQFSAQGNKRKGEMTPVEAEQCVNGEGNGGDGGGRKGDGGVKRGCCRRRKNVVGEAG